MNRLSRLYIILLLIFTIGQLTTKAATVDTVETYSTAMHKNIKAVIIKPNQYNKLKALPTVYLLHGAGGDYSSFINQIPALKDMADKYHSLLVCADGNVTSWYFDSPVKPEWRYETYVGTELVQWVDAHYKTIKSRTARAITGYSMGGHGAMYLSFKHPDVFGAAGSMSGGVDFRPFPKNWKIAEKLGSYAEKPENWDKNTVINMINFLTPDKLALIIDCGTEDFFYNVNLNFHEALLAKKIPHDFIIRPGAHNFTYWRNAVKYQMLFFHEYFEKQNFPDAN